MADKTAIEWTDATWNPVTGCDRVSPGCAHCYALELAAKFKDWGQPRYQKDGGKASGPGFGVTLHEDKLDEPLRWRKPRRVFVNSMSDLFHDEIPDDFIDRVFATMAAAPQHTFQVLTKRPERMLEYLTQPEQCGRLGDPPLPNVWLGVTIENRRFVDRADLLRATPAAVRFVSAEPLLGPLVWEADGCPQPVWDGPYKMRCSLGGDGTVCARHGRFVKERAGLDLADIDWLIAGGESGPRHRPIDPQWVRDLRDACLDQALGHLRPDPAGRTAFFFKQWGGARPKSNGRELDGREWSEMPHVTGSAT